MDPLEKIKLIVPAEIRTSILPIHNLVTISTALTCLSVFRKYLIKLIKPSNTALGESQVTRYSVKFYRVSCNL